MIQQTNGAMSFSQLRDGQEVPLDGLKIAMLTIQRPQANRHQANLGKLPH